MNSVTKVSALSRNRVDDAECAPELAEALEDQPRVPDASHCTQSHNHLLVHVKHRDQQHQRPQQGRAVILPGLGVGPEGTGIVVAHHDDQTGS
jgi:hypothetical protein